MAEDVDNLVLEQLRLIRETLGQTQTRMDDMEKGLKSGIADLRGELLGQRAVLIGLGTYIGAIAERVEHIEDHLGIAK